MHEKLATREPLSSRGLIDVERESSCSFCFRGVESCKHMFFDCNFSSNIWRGIWTWIGIQGPLETDSFISFLKFGELNRRKKLKEGKYIIWLVIVWCIWLHRNKIIFEGGATDYLGLLHHIKSTSWVWLSANRRGSLQHCLTDWFTIP